MKALPKILLALTAVAALSVAYPARANFIATINQVGANVVVTGSGAFDLTGLSNTGGVGVSASINPATTGFLVLASGSTTDYSGAFSGPTSFGSGGDTFASSWGGDAVAISGPNVHGNGDLFVPVGYVSGTLLSDSSIYNGATFASLGLTPGIYEWTWGNGANQNFTLDIVAPAVPDSGSTVSLLGCALLGLAALRRKLSC